MDCCNVSRIAFEPHTYTIEGFSASETHLLLPSD